MRSVHLFLFTTVGCRFLLLFFWFVFVSLASLFFASFKSTKTGKKTVWYTAQLHSDRGHTMLDEEKGSSTNKKTVYPREYTFRECAANRCTIYYQLISGPAGAAAAGVLFGKFVIVSWERMGRSLRWGSVCVVRCTAERKCNKRGENVCTNRCRGLAKEYDYSWYRKKLINFVQT